MPTSAETLVLDAGRLRVVFTRAGDRYRHAISLTDGALWAESLESDADAPWPVSPPWQEAHAERGPNGEPLLLLVGMAGKSHWSMSVAVGPDRNSLLFDVACRLRTPAERLGSSYQVKAAGLCQVNVESPAPGAAIAKLHCEGDQLEIIPAPASGKLPETVRWKYAVSA